MRIIFFVMSEFCFLRSLSKVLVNLQMRKEIKENQKVRVFLLYCSGRCIYNHGAVKKHLENFKMFIFPPPNTDLVISFSLYCSLYPFSQRMHSMAWSAKPLSDFSSS